MTAAVGPGPAALAAAGLRAPEYGGECLDGVLPAALGALGLELPAGDGRDTEAARRRFDVPRTDRVCVVLVDGLGHALLAERAGHAPFLRGRLPDARVLTVGFPSTTAASIGLFGTGRSSGRTGLAGYTVRNPATGGLANLVSWEGLDRSPAWQREPSLFRHVADAGVPVTSVGPARFAGSGLTVAALAPSVYVPAESLDDRVDAAVVALRRPGLVYLYWGDVDKVGHHAGWRSPEWGDALSELDRGLAALARRLPGGAALLVTADHGQVEVDADAIVDVAQRPSLATGVELVAGEPRAAHVHLTDGSAAGVAAAASRWRAELGDDALVTTRDEAIGAGWFGEVAPHVRPVIGDLVVAALGVGGVGDSRTQTAASLRLRGMHGSLTPGEMLVPLIVVA